MSNDEKPVRWMQTHRHNLHGHTVGVMNVFEKDGAAVAQVSVRDPRTAAGEEAAVADRRSRVVASELARAGERAWVDVTPSPTLR